MQPGAGTVVAALAFCAALAVAKAPVRKAPSPSVASVSESFAADFNEERFGSIASRFSYPPMQEAEDRVRDSIMLGLVYQGMKARFGRIDSMVPIRSIPKAGAMIWTYTADEEYWNARRFSCDEVALYRATFSTGKVLLLRFKQIREQDALRVCLFNLIAAIPEATPDAEVQRLAKGFLSDVSGLMKDVNAKAKAMGMKPIDLIGLDEAP